MLSTQTLNFDASFRVVDRQTACTICRNRNAVRNTDRLTGDDPWTSATCPGKRTKSGEKKEGERRLLRSWHTRKSRVRQSLCRGSLEAPRVLRLLSCLSSSHRSIKRDHTLDENEKRRRASCNSVFLREVWSICKDDVRASRWIGGTLRDDRCEELRSFYETKFHSLWGMDAYRTLAVRVLERIGSKERKFLRFYDRIVRELREIKQNTKMCEKMERIKSGIDNFGCSILRQTLEKPLSSLFQRVAIFSIIDRKKQQG